MSRGLGDVYKRQNVQMLKRDIEDNIKEDTKAVILDASAIGSMDITAADQLEMLYQGLKKRGICFYITEHIADLNEQMRKLGLGHIIEEGSARRTIHIALKDMGYERPYPLEGGVDNRQRSASRKRADNRVQEFVWAFGSETEDAIERQIVAQIEQLKKTGDVEKLLHGSWSHRHRSAAVQKYPARTPPHRHCHSGDLPGGRPACSRWESPADGCGWP